jgi:hypothetical protein
MNFTTTSSIKLGKKFLLRVSLKSKVKKELNWSLEINMRIVYMEMWRSSKRGRLIR